MIIVLFGAPGVGKGTQAEILASKLSISHLSTGDAFRKAIGNQTPIGIKAKQFVDAGSLVPDEIVAGIVEEAIEAPEFSKGCILDGFPRTRNQAEVLQGILDRRGIGIDAVVNITVDDTTIVDRLLSRGRADDREDIIRHRLSVYNNETAPLLEFYQSHGILQSIDGIGDVEHVNQRILDALKAKNASIA